MKLKSLILSIFSLSILSCNSLDGITGSGPVKTKEITNLSDFDAVSISRGLNIELTQGNENKATIEADENLLEVIKVFVENNTLTITSDKNIRKAKSKKVLLTFKNLEKLNINSGSYVTNKGFIKNKNLTITVHSGANAKLNTKSDFLTCEVHSGSKLDLEGFTNSANLRAHSGANLQARNLKSKTVVAEAHSGASLKTFASESIKATAHSGASIRFAGNPTTVSKSAHSGGSVSKI